jgi:hypothetical protein
MSGEDLITSMQTAVKMEVVEYYFRERRIVEEEIAMVFESSRDYHIDLAMWRKDRDTLFTILFSPEYIDRFAELTGLAGFGSCCLLSGDRLKFKKPGGAMTRFGRYHRLVTRLYRELYESAGELNEKREDLIKLHREVNRDISHFELNHDLLAITSYLRSLNPAELQKRKILGVNFSAKETAAAAAALSFRPIKQDNLGLERRPDPMIKPGLLQPKVKGLLKKISKEMPKHVDSLFNHGETLL